MNDAGWAEQMKLIERHLAKARDRWPATPR
jgi:hypothetical protein